jgi:hypothetical protein
MINSSVCPIKALPHCLHLNESPAPFPGICKGTKIRQISAFARTMTPSHIVIAGLDPAIDRNDAALGSLLDARVQAAHDERVAGATSS